MSLARSVPGSGRLPGHLGLRVGIAGVLACASVASTDASARAWPSPNLDRIEPGLLASYASEFDDTKRQFVTYSRRVGACLAGVSGKRDRCLDAASDASDCGSSPAACIYLQRRAWDMFVDHYGRLLAPRRKASPGRMLALWSAKASAECAREAKSEPDAQSNPSVFEETCLAGKSTRRALELRAALASRK
jgi:hypothetical protein